MSRYMVETQAPEMRYHLLRQEDRQREQVLAMATTMVSLLDLRDSYTGGHSARVAEYSQAIALRLGLDSQNLDTVVMAAAIHDIGKIGVPDQVLLKQGRLTEEEYECIKKHSEFGWMVLRNISGFEEAGLMLLHHHERLDGRGYPGELSGNAIPLGSRIIAVADTFDALTTNRPYRTARTEEFALDEIRRCAGTQFDPEIVEAFLQTR